MWAPLTWVRPHCQLVCTTELVNGGNRVARQLVESAHMSTKRLGTATLPSVLGRCWREPRSLTVALRAQASQQKPGLLCVQVQKHIDIIAVGPTSFRFSMSLRLVSLSLFVVRNSWADGCLWITSCSCCVRYGYVNPHQLVDPDDRSNDVQMSHCGTVYFLLLTVVP